MPQRRVILLDLDGVLVDSSAAVERAWRGWASRHDLDPGAVLAIAHGRRSQDTIREAAPHLDAELEALVLERDETAESDGLHALPGAAELLGSLAPGTWAVVTSGTRELATARLKAAGLPIPAVLVTAEDVVNGKPDPEGYLRAAGSLGAEPGECVVIEDAPAGIAAALAAGMMAIGVTSTHARHELRAAHLIVERVADVRPALT